MDAHTIIPIVDRVSFWKRTIFSGPTNPGKYILSILLIITIGMACGIVLEPPQNAAALIPSTGIIVPLYSYPGQVWDDLVKEKNSHPSVPVVAIINPDSGPGERDPNYATGIKKLQSAGIIVLGYVYTHKVDSSTIKNYVNDYKNWYGINGIFFDGMSNVSGNEKFYADISNYTKSQGLNYTVGNPGTDTLPSYIGTVDNMVLYDNPGLPLVSSLGGWHTNFTRNNFSIVSYGVNDLNKTYVENIAKHVQYMYVTNSTLPNPFSTLPKYFDGLMGMIENYNKQNNKTSSVFITVRSYSDNGVPINGLWTEIGSDKNNISGFTPFSSPVVSGNSYTITMSNFQNYTFDHWDDGTINGTKIVVPNKNITLSAYYGSSPSPMGFSHLHITRGMYSVLATGQYTNGGIPYVAVFPRLNLYDNSSHLIGTGLGTMWNVGAYDSQSFQILVNVSKAFKSYAIVVDKAVSKNAITDLSSHGTLKSTTGLSAMPSSHTLSCNCTPHLSPSTQNTSSITVTLAYVGGDRAYSSTMALKVYQDANQTVYRDIESLSGNPFNITSLPVNHRYKIEAYANGMYSSVGYVDLQKTPQKLTLNLPLPGGLQPRIFYNDGYTPIFNATVSVLSQDNKTWASSLTDSSGNTLRFWLEPTIIDSNYFVVDVHISPHISYSYSPISLHPGTSQNIKIITPWPAKVEDLFTVKIYNGQSSTAPTAKGNFIVYLFDNNGNAIGQSKTNYRGEANFSNLKVGDYTIKAIDAQNNREWGQSNIVIDGTKTSFAIFQNQTSSGVSN